MTVPEFEALSEWLSCYQELISDNVESGVNVPVTPVIHDSFKTISGALGQRGRRGCTQSLTMDTFTIDGSLDPYYTDDDEDDHRLECYMAFPNPHSSFKRVIGGEVGN